MTTWATAAPAPDPKVVRTGELLAVVAAIAFSMKSILGKLAMARGIDPVPLLVLRMSFAAPFFLAVLVRDRGAPISRADGARLVVLGVIGFHAAMVLDFMGLQYITAGLERLVLYAHPTMILIIGWLWLRRPAHLREAVGVGVCWAGLALAVGGDLGAASPEDVARGVGLVLLSAFAYAIYLLATEQLAPRIGARRVGAAASLTSGVTLVMQAAWTGQLDEAIGADAETLRLVFALVAIATVAPVLLLAEAITRIGPARAATIGMIGPFSAALLGWLVLGEPLAASQLVGGVIVVAGITLGRPRPS